MVSAAAAADPAAEVPARTALENGAPKPAPTVATLHMAHSAELDEMIKVWQPSKASGCLDALQMCSRRAADTAYNLGVGHTAVGRRAC